MFLSFLPKRITLVINVEKTKYTTKKTKEIVFKSALFVRFTVHIVHKNICDL